MTGNRGPLVVVGDALLDIDVEGTTHRCAPGTAAPVLEDAATWHRPGGAALAAWLAAREERHVVLVTALAADARGDRLAALVGDVVNLVRLPMRGTTPAKIRVGATEGTLARIDEGEGTAQAPACLAGVREALAGAGTVLVSDYGRGVASLAGIRSALARCAGTVPVVWDPHPRGARPVRRTRMVTPNAEEAGVAEHDLSAAAARAAEAVRTWEADSVAVTLGGGGAVWVPARGPGCHIAAPARHDSRDACGAGDRFSACAARALSDGADPAAAVQEAVHAASEYVRRGGARLTSTPFPGPLTGALPLGLGEGAAELAARVRAGGGRIVAAGGCFDVLHAGHVDLLRRARSLGDCLIVCLNSDRSVHALKGGNRPLVPESDRARVVSALDCVDAIEVFGEPTPEALLDRLRPHVWVKGTDYTGRELPETAAVAAYGGEVVLLPTLPGRSTTRLVTAARAGGG